MLLKYALLVSLLAATPATLALPDGSPCPGGDGDCDSQLCEPAGATDATCQSRPSGVGTRCSPSLGQDQCISGYCDSASLVCSLISEGGLCYGGPYCANGAICGFPRSGGDQVCLGVGRNAGDQCDDNAQCTGNTDLVCGAESKCEQGDNRKADGANCEGTNECQSGICEDQIADDGFQRVCLPGNLENNEACSHRYQCQSGNCATASDGSLKCLDPNTGTPAVEPSASTGDNNNNNNNNNNNGGGQPDVVVITTVQNGQTLTLTQTRTVTVRGSSTAGTTQRLASASARPSGAAVAGPQAGGVLGWMLAGAAVMLGGVGL